MTTAGRGYELDEIFKSIDSFVLDLGASHPSTMNQLPGSVNSRLSRANPYSLKMLFSRSKIIAPSRKQELSVFRC
jgi:hypothetical protein